MPHREPCSCELSACAALAGRLPHRVLLAVPDLRHIPTFALPVEKARAPFAWSRLGGFDRLVAIVGRDAADGLQEGRYGAYRVIDTRTRIDWQTALYALWCVFAAAGHAEAFERDHPHLGLPTLSARAEAALQRAQAADTAQPDRALDGLRSQARALTQLRQSIAIGNDEQLGLGASSCSP